MQEQIQKIIEKAIEGGWCDYLEQITRIDTDSTPYDGKFYIHFSDKDKDGEMHNYTIYETFCDPLFWQALGKACPIKEVTMTVPARYVRRVTKNGIETINWPTHTRKRKFPFSWKKHALKFHEINLTKGWEKAVEYIYQLTNNKDE